MKAAVWRPATAHVVDDNDPIARLTHFPDGHARVVQRAGTPLLSVRFDSTTPNRARSTTFPPGV